MAILSYITVTRTGWRQETSASDHHKPYVLMIYIDLRPARPEVATSLYGPWQANNSEVTTNNVPLIWQESFWKLDIRAAHFARPDDAILLIALMEHFDGNPRTLSSVIKKTVLEALDASVSIARKARVATLIHDINASVDLANGGPNQSSATEMSLTDGDVARLATDGSSRLVRSFYGYGGHYCLGFEFIEAESDLRDRAAQEQGALACAA